MSPAVELLPLRHALSTPSPARRSFTGLASEQKSYYEKPEPFPNVGGPASSPHFPHPDETSH